MPRAKVAVIHPKLGSGGSESPTLWTIEALKRDYGVTLITMGGVDLDRLNAYYGTLLTPGDLSIRRVPLPWGLRNTAKFAGLQGRFLQRYVQGVAPEFDVLISCYGPMNFGKRGIQMIADFSFVEEWRFSLHPGVRSWKRWWYGPSPVRRLYSTLSDRISRNDPEGWKHNVTLSNSDWTARLMREKYDIESQTVYPPVQGAASGAPFAQREKGFLCLGRISAEKRVESIIEIVSKVRQRGHDVHLHILGGLDGSPYALAVRRLAEQNPHWVFLDGWVAGQKKHDLLTGHRYGINARTNEAFGIAVAEMVLAGCLVFVPKGGGQTEIVDHPALLFESDDDAVEKIHAALASEQEEQRLRSHLRQRSQVFSVESFVASMRQVVAQFTSV